MLKTLFILLVYLVVIFAGNGFSQTDYSTSDITKVVLLGTGNPNPDPKHPGCSIAIVVNDTPYIGVQPMSSCWRKYLKFTMVKL